MEQEESTGIALADLNGGIRVSISEFKNIKYCDIRKFFTDDSGTLRPTRKGIALSLKQFDEVLDYLVENRDLIRQKLTS